MWGARESNEVNKIEKLPASKWGDDPGRLALIALFQGILGVAVGLAIWWATGRDVFAFVTWQSRDIFIGAITAVVLLLTMQSIVFAFPNFLRWAADQQRMLFEHGRCYSRLHISMISFGAGVGEEAMFRGGLQTLLGDHLPPWVAIGLVGLVFAALHWGSRGVFAFIFTISAVFGGVFYLTGSLLSSMIGHVAFDVWALTMVQREFVRQGMVR